jgi:rubrerythrin
MTEQEQDWRLSFAVRAMQRLGEKVVLPVVWECRVCHLSYHGKGRIKCPECGRPMTKRK